MTGVIAGSSKLWPAVRPRHADSTTKRRLVAGGGVRAAAETLKANGDGKAQGLGESEQRPHENDRRSREGGMRAEEDVV